MAMPAARELLTRGGEGERGEDRMWECVLSPEVGSEGGKGGEGGRGGASEEIFLVPYST